MPGTFTYTAATNTVVVTEGTSAAPATFADFVTADRAGTLTLLNAAVITGSPQSFSLTTAIRPVDKRVIKIKITTSADRAGATATVVGKDGDGDAISEGLDISTAKTTPITTVLKYASIDASGLTITGMTNGDTITVTQAQWGVIWDHGYNHYTIDSLFAVGNSTTSTYFQQISSNVRFNNRLTLLANATLVFGQYNNGRTRRGCRIEMNYNDATWNQVSGTLELYATIVKTVANNQQTKFVAGSIFKAKDSVIDFNDSNGRWSAIEQNNPPNTGGFVENYRTLNGMFGVAAPMGDNLDNIWPQDAAEGLHFGGMTNPTVTCKNVIISNCTKDITFSWLYGTGNFYIINSTINWATISWDSQVNGTQTAWQQYTVDIHVADKDGVNLSGATVLCQDKNDNTIFSVSTALDGTITQQNVTHTAYIYSGGASTVVYNPHKFTISKAGYQTLVLENITVDKPIVWHLELQQPSIGGAAYKNIGIGVYA